jgi:hypothetical protein
VGFNTGCSTVCGHVNRRALTSHTLHDLPFLRLPLTLPSIFCLDYFTMPKLFTVQDIPSKLFINNEVSILENSGIPVLTSRSGLKELAEH